MTKIERFKKGNFLLILMKKSYTLSKYGRDKRLVQAVEEMGFDNLDVYHKIDLLKVFGYENLKGGLSGLPANEMAIDLLCNILHNSALLSKMLIEHQEAIEPENPLSPGDLSQLVEEGIDTIISRVNQAFQKTYDYAVKRVAKYEAGALAVQRTLSSTQPAQPLEQRVKQEQPEQPKQPEQPQKPAQQQLPGIPPHRPSEESYFYPGGKKKRYRRRRN